LTQGAEIVGLNTATFAEALSNIASIEARFGEHLAGVEISNNLVGQGSIGEAFISSNRIFTPHQDVPTEQDNQFQDGIDPLGHLAKLKKGELIHAPENVVMYFARVYDAKNT
jgi:hypothetical protein